MVFSTFGQPGMGSEIIPQLFKYVEILITIHNCTNLLSIQEIPQLYNWGQNLAIPTTSLVGSRLRILKHVMPRSARCEVGLKSLKTFKSEKGTCRLLSRIHQTYREHEQLVRLCDETPFVHPFSLYYTLPEPIKKKSLL